MGTATTSTVITHCIPTIVAAALLELDEGNIVAPLVTDVPYSGPGLVHNTPFISRLTAEADDTLDYQPMSTGSDEATNPSAATCGVHGAYIMLKDIAALGASSDLAAAAGQLIGQCLVVRRDLDLVTLFSSFSTDQGSSTSVAIAPADLYDAYGSLRKYHAPLPYHLVLHPSQIWNSNGLIACFDNSSDAFQSVGLGSVGEDWSRYGFAGMAMGFNLWSDSNITFTSAAGSGAAFSREAIKNVRKRDFQIEVQRDGPNVSDLIIGTEIRGEAILRNRSGNEMQFRSFVAS